LKLRSKVSLVLALLTAVSAFLKMSIFGVAWVAGEGGP